MYHINYVPIVVPLYIVDGLQLFCIYTAYNYILIIFKKKIEYI